MKAVLRPVLVGVWAAALVLAVPWLDRRAEIARWRSLVATAGQVTNQDVDDLQVGGGFPHGAVLLRFNNRGRQCAAWGAYGREVSAWVCVGRPSASAVGEYRRQLMEVAPWSVANFGIEVSDLPAPEVAP